MKARFLALAALVLGLASCQTEPEGLNVNVGGEVDTTITVTIPDTETRAGGNDSAVGAFGNVDFTGANNTEDLTVRYILQIYQKVNDQYVASKETKFEYSDERETITFDVRLVPGRDYKFVVWADVVKEATKEDDWHYNTHNGEDGVTDLTNVTLLNDTWVAMDETRDAFTGVKLVENYSSSSNINFQLTRPFAKLRIVTTDVEALTNLGIQPNNAVVTYTTPYYNSFNALTEEYTKGNATKTHTTYTIAPYGDNDDDNMVLYTDYLFVKNDVVKFSLTVNENGGKLIKHNDFTTDIPVQRNYLTTIQGDILTDGNNIKVTVDERFEQPDHIVDIWDGKSKTEPAIETNEEGKSVAVIDSASDLAWLADFVNGLTASTFATRAGSEPVHFVLAADIDLNNMPWTSVGTEENNFVGSFDGKGHSIKNLNIEVAEAKEGKAYLGFFGYAKNATIKNVTFENVYINIPCLDIDHSQGHIGAVAGSLEGTSTIENVTVKGDITVYTTQDANGASRVAVVAGGNAYGDVTMKNVHVVANEGSSLIANNNVGALAGQLQGKMVFENCSSNINVTANKFFAGGLVGIAAGDSTFTNCHTTGDVSVVAGREGRHNDEYRVGGIAGGWADGKTKVCTLEDCTYSGELYGANADGTVVENFDYAGYVGRGYTLSNCAGSKVIVNGDEYVQAYDTTYGVYYVNGAYEVNTAADLNALANDVNSGKDFFEDKSVVLTADIDLENQEWTPIGSAYKDHGFMGNFDGKTYTIKNLTINNITPDTDGYVYAGLFGVTEGTEGNHNSIKNLTIENVNINTNGHIVAAAIAYPYYTDLENIKVKGNISIKGGDYTSGVLAYTRRCVDAKNISIIGNEDSVIEGNETIGGVISDIQMNGGLTANYSNFAASGLTIKGTKSVGGISGIISQQTLDGATVKNVTIVCEDARKGIISGSVGEASVINNVIVENVTGAENFVGTTYDSGKSSKVTIDDVVYEYLADGQLMIDGKIVVKVSTAEELNKLKATNAYVVLCADIDFQDAAMTKPIELWGNSTFDGMGHKISNVITAVQGGYATSLFRGDANPGNKVVKNLVIENITTPTGYDFAAAVWSDLQGANIEIDNVHINDATVAANGTIGGFVGFVSGSTTSVVIKNSSINNSNLNGGEADHKRGAVVGRAYGCAVACENVVVDNVKINDVAATTTTLVGDKGYTGTVTVK